MGLTGNTTNGPNREIQEGCVKVGGVFTQGTGHLSDVDKSKVDYQSLRPWVEKLEGIVFVKRLRV